MQQIAETIGVGRATLYRHLQPTSTSPAARPRRPRSTLRRRPLLAYATSENADENHRDLSTEPAACSHDPVER
jgi:hypothetical protein